MISTITDLRLSLLHLFKDYFQQCKIYTSVLVCVFTLKRDVTRVSHTANHIQSHYPDTMLNQPAGKFNELWLSPL